MIFLYKSEVLAIQARAIDEFGGLHGLRDEAALESALISAENRHFYEQADLATCAATYAYHLCQSHAFIDGNKRVAAAVTIAFLRSNDALLVATREQLRELFLGIAAGEISREQAEILLRTWIN